jgi:hypothetical protein
MIKISKWVGIKLLLLEQEAVTNFIASLTWCLVWSLAEHPFKGIIMFKRYLFV